MKTSMILPLLTILMFLTTLPYKPFQSEMEQPPDVAILGVLMLGKGTDAVGSATFAIRIKNSGKKTVTAISWEQLLIVPAGDNRVTINLDLKSGALYLRGAEEQTVLSVVKNVLDSSMTRVPPERVRLTRVEYDDGSTWQRPDKATK